MKKRKMFHIFLLNGLGLVKIAMCMVYFISVYDDVGIACLYMVCIRSDKQSKSMTLRCRGWSFNPAFSYQQNPLLSSLP